MDWVELFAGAGGAALGIKQAGGDALACVEWDADAAATLEAAGFPAVHQDVREWVGEFADQHPFTPVDAMWASFPCQAWSTAGKRLGKDDPRNGWPWTVDAIDVVEPCWFVAENVPGLAQHTGECDPVCTGECAHAYLTGTILPQLAERFACVQWVILDAADYGVPQHRRRVIIVAGPTRVRWPRATHGDPDQVHLFLPLKPYATFGEALGLTGHLDSGRPPDVDPGAASSRPAPTVGGGRNQMLRVVGGGRNPQDSEAPRTYRDLTDEPSTTVAAAQVGNAGPWVCAPDAARELLERPAVTVTTTSPPTLARVVAQAIKEADDERAS